MSTFRKTVLTTAIIGAGLATTAGSAFATDCSHDSHSGHSSHEASKSSECTNNVKALNQTKGGGLADVLGGAQTVAPINACDILSHNSLLNGNDISLLGGL